MKIAIPLANGRLAMHFGHCEEFALVDVDEENNTVTGEERVTPPAHAPGALPQFLAEQGAAAVIAGGMGMRAQGLFAENGIRVLTGAPARTPREIVEAYLDGSLDLGDNVCDH